MTAPAETARPAPGRRLLLLAVTALGVSSIFTQLVLMRELLGVLAGNEMIFGIILGNWLLLTGLGARLGRGASRLRRPFRVLTAAQIVVAVLPIASVFLLRTLRNVVFVRGAMIGVVEAVACCFVLLLPYCLLAGYLLTLACEVLAQRRDAASIGQDYFLDVLGDILGGAAFTFLLVGLLDHFEALYIPALLNLALAVAVALRARQRIVAVVAGTVAAGGIVLAATVDLDAVSRRIEYAGREIVYRGDSPYGSLIVTASGGQYDFIANGRPLLSTDDVIHQEQTVHYAMAQRPAARRVLLISGGASGTTGRSSSTAWRRSTTSNWTRWCSRWPGGSVPRRSRTRASRSSTPTGGASCRRPTGGTTSSSPTCPTRLHSSSTASTRWSSSARSGAFSARAACSA